MELTDNEIRKIHMMCKFEHAVENLYYAYNVNTLILKYLWYYYIVKDADFVRCIINDKVLIKSKDGKYSMVDIMSDRICSLCGEVHDIVLIGEYDYLYVNDDSVIILGKNLEETFRQKGEYLGHYYFGDRYAEICIKQGDKKKYIQYNIYTSKRVYGKK